MRVMVIVKATRESERGERTSFGNRVGPLHIYRCSIGAERIGRLAQGMRTTTVSLRRFFSRNCRKQGSK